MEIFTWLAKVTWWFDGEKTTDYTLYYGETLEEVAKQIDEDYGKDSEEVTITIIKEGHFNFESEELAKLILEEKE